ncbi:hypothetical protein RISK_006667 [Rhodopirellula islandica]|uniref:Uncharacterized protein n=1 Tax=Rhodopirellula islandica TaxID=595434 RepID=A0A0J1B4W5_RHOIS|nr:hypothetical protein RISK_006667 [Rhodopirellula islandica]
MRVGAYEWSRAILLSKRVDWKESMGGCEVSGETTPTIPANC